MENQKRNKLDRGTLIWISISILIPILVIMLTGISPKQKHAWIFLIVILAMYSIGIFLIIPLFKMNSEIKKINNIIREEKFNNIESLEKELKKEEFKDLNFIFKNFRESFKKKTRINNNGSTYVTYFRSSEAEVFFDEESLIHKKINTRTVTHLSQALTGLGIFGTFMGIVDGLSNLNMSDTASMESGVRTLLNGVKFSFNTSLYGVMFSIILIFVMKVVNDSIMKKAYEFCGEIDRIIPIYSEDSSIEDIVAILKRQNSITEKLSSDLAEELGIKFENSLNLGLDGLAKEVSKLVTNLEANMNENSKVSVEGLTAMGSILTRSIETMEDMKNAQEKSSGKILEETMRSIKETIAISTSSETEKLNESMKVISEKNIGMVEEFKTSMDNMRTLITHQENLMKSSVNSTESMNETTVNMKELQGELSAVIIGLRDVNKDNSISIDSINKTVEEMKNSIGKQLEINRSLEGMINSSQSIAKNQESYMVGLKDMSENITTNMGVINGSLGSLTSDIKVFEESFEKISNNFEGSIRSLQNNYDNIAKSMDKANSELKLTIKEMDSLVVEKVKSINSTYGNVVKLAEENNKKSLDVTKTLGEFLETEDASRKLWKSYKNSFDNLNENINEGIIEYTNQITDQTNRVFKEYDIKISGVLIGLNRVITNLNDVVSSIDEQLEGLQIQKDKRGVH